ncbi:UPF0103-domain-containing protein [Polychaeton citri CBS 116435]|uniref:UPF0103-domain-containing protein n=1 Tax=Polychaeton citri CBS 116435 TaxID=1314669 RepID=A0A9P4QFD7_9PEZI|nr:UPF0103-domain-containing protein [Polychaeton citri CBS 116435]
MSNSISYRVREASHAGSWYSANKSQLDSQLEGWLAAAKASVPLECIGPLSSKDGEQGKVDTLPVTGGRVVIAPHAGYAYSGPAAGFAYSAWDVSKARRLTGRDSRKKVFLLGPSHHHYLSRAALSRCTSYETPLGDLAVDRETTDQLYQTGAFEWMDINVDEAEHSLEMHLPYIYKILSSTFGTQLPPLVPIMIGNTSARTERAIGQILEPYLSDPSTAWVVSSDFAHWGSRFGYTYYRDASGRATDLRSSASDPKSPPIHESIRNVDFECMGACETGSHGAWLEVLDETRNTVCGRHPIGVVMCAIEEVVKKRREEDEDGGDGKFKFVRYERSSQRRSKLANYHVEESSIDIVTRFQPSRHRATQALNLGSLYALQAYARSCYGITRLPSAHIRLEEAQIGLYSGLHGRTCVLQTFAAGCIQRLRNVHVGSKPLRNEQEQITKINKSSA